MPEDQQAGHPLTARSRLTERNILRRQLLAPPTQGPLVRMDLDSPFASGSLAAAVFAIIWLITGGGVGTGLVVGGLLVGAIATAITSIVHAVIVTAPARTQRRPVGRSTFAGPGGALRTGREAAPRGACVCRQGDDAPSPRPASLSPVAARADSVTSSRAPDTFITAPPSQDRCSWCRGSA